jgi:hypothetical protein
VAASRLVRGAALVWWRRLPDAAARVSATLRMALRDGDYLLSTPLVAAVAPPLAVLSGVLLGAVHPGRVFSASLLVVLAFAAVAGLGAAPGLGALIGYALGDLALHARGAATAGTLLRTDGAALDTYLILAGLLVVAPLAATAVRQRGQRLMRPGTARLVIGFAVAATVQAALAYLWAQAAAVLIRPVWSFRGAAPDPGSIVVLRRDGVWIALVTLLAVAGRGALTAVAARRPAAPPDPAYVRFRVPRPWPWPVAVTLRAAVFTLLLAGLVGSALGAALVFALFAVLGVLRYRVVPALRPYARIVSEVPLLARAAVCCLVGYLMALLVVRPAVERGVTSFLPLVVALIPPLLLAAFLLPARGAGGSEVRSGG